MRYTLLSKDDEFISKATNNIERVLSIKETKKQERKFLVTI